MALVELNEDEQRVMDTITCVFRKMNEKFKGAHGGSSMPALVLLLDVSKPPGSTFYEMSTEIIARKARNFRMTNAFRNKLLSWNSSVRTTFAFGEMGASTDNSLTKLWLEGVVEYYKGAFITVFSTLGEEFNGEMEETKDDWTRAGGSSNRHFASGQDALSDSEWVVLMDRAQLYMKPDLCCSPEFAKILRLSLEFLRSYEICGALTRSFSDFGTMASVMNPGNSTSRETENRVHEYVLEDKLRSRVWLFLLFSTLLGALQLHHIQSTKSSPSLAGAAWDVTASSKVGSLTDDELRSGLQAVAQLIRMVSADRISAADIMNITSLRFARSACMTSFPPQEVVRQLEEHNAVLNKALAEFQPLPALAAAQYAEQPLFRLLTKDIPKLTKEMEEFISSASVDKAWVTTVIVMQLFRFNPKQLTNAGTSRTTEALKAFGTHTTDDASIGYEVSSDVKPRDSVLFALLIAFLRPLMRQLLLCEAPRTNSSGNATDETARGGDAKDRNIGGQEQEGENSDLVLTEAQTHARQALEEISLAACRIVIPFSANMRGWALIGVGDHKGLCEHFGEACMQEAISEVLNEVMLDTVLWTTKPPSLWKHIRETVDKTRTLTEDESLRFFKHLMRTERYYNALTDSSVKAKTFVAAGVEDAGETPISINVLQKFKDQYYKAVSSALAHIYPGNASIALILPVVNSTHNYLLRQEEAQGSKVSGSGGGAGVPVRMAPHSPPGVKSARKGPPPGPPGGKRPPGGGPSRPGPSAHIVELLSDADFKSALRLVSSIESTDFFFAKYKEMLRLRLAFRPPPNRIRDELFDSAKPQLEREALEYLSGVIGERRELKDMRMMADSMKPSHFSGANDGSEVSGGTKLVVHVLDWRTWGIEAEKNYLVKDSDAGNDAKSSGGIPHIVNVAAAGAPTQSEPLPFPRDLWAVLNEFQNSYQSSHKGKLLRWFSPELSQSSFSIAFPNDSGRKTTIHGSLLLQQLLLAISQYRRQGVSYATLANRAHSSDVELLRRMLTPLVERDKLLVVVNKDEVPARSPEERIALNYDFTRSPSNPTGEYNYWLGCKRLATAIDENEQREMRERRVLLTKASTIQVMKSVRSIAHSELLTKVGEKVSREFQLTPYYFKLAIEALIEQNFIERDTDVKNSAAYKYKA